MPEPNRRRWSLGFWILISSMMGIFSLVIGILLMSFNLSEFHSTNYTNWSSGDDHHAVNFESLDPQLSHGLEMYHSGMLQAALGEFSKCRDSSPVCEYNWLELRFGLSDFGDDIYSEIEESARHGNPYSQYLVGLLFSNRFSNTTEYTSQTFPRSVLMMYAASTSVHPGSLLAMGYRHLKGYGVPKRCETAALNYLEVAKPVANIYAASIPRAVELIRLNVEKDKKILTINEISLFTEVANTNSEIALAVGKRFLLGSDGFPQDYDQAKRFLTISSERGHEPAAFALLGYIHALGLGVPVNQQIAEDMFTKGISDGLGMNGLGYLRFKQDLVEESFSLFNKSASAGSSDGMFNLASLYLTGTGTSQNFQKAFMWFTEALRRGHTPAGYALAVMHLNGIGTVKDCNTAVSLLKEVAERGEYVSSTLRLAYQLTNQGQHELAALQFLKLAEGGHQVSQENLAHLIDSGQAGKNLFGYSNSEIFSQRFFELAAAQGSISSALRLGDYAFYGQGIDAKMVEEEEDGSVSVVHELKHVDYLEAVKWYKKARDDGNKVANLMGGLSQAPHWISGIINLAEFNLGYMYQFGLGVRKNLIEAGNHYRRSIPLESHGKVAIEWLINTFVSPAYVDLVEDEDEEESEMTEKVHVIQDHRIALVVALLALLCALVYLRRRR